MNLKVSILISIMMTALGSFAQVDTIVTYFNLKNEITLKEDTEAFYYSKTWKDGDTWVVNDFYIDGNPKMTGFFIKDQPIKHGKFVYYSIEGKKILEGDYENEIMVGEWKSYYEDGSVRSKENFANTIVELLQDKTFRYLNFINKESYLYKREGQYNGTSIWYHPNGQIASEELYKNGMLVKVNFWDENGNKVRVKKDNHGYMIESEARQTKDFVHYIEKKLKPLRSRILENEIEKNQIVGLMFILSEFGEIEFKQFYKIKVTDKDLINEVSKIMKDFKDYWEPARCHNLKESVGMTIFIWTK